MSGLASCGSGGLISAGRARSHFRRLRRNFPSGPCQLLFGAGEGQRVEVLGRVESRRVPRSRSTAVVGMRVRLQDT